MSTWLFESFSFNAEIGNKVYFTNLFWRHGSSWSVFGGLWQFDSALYLRPFFGVLIVHARKILQEERHFSVSIVFPIFKIRTEKSNRQTHLLVYWCRLFLFYNRYGSYKRFSETWNAKLSSKSYLLNQNPVMLTVFHLLSIISWRCSKIGSGDFPDIMIFPCFFTTVHAVKTY